jgi:alkylhydroperoxidase family enzyme
MTWLAEHSSADTPLGEVLGLRPELDRLYGAYMAEIWSACDPVVLDLCRLRIAALLGDADQQRLRHDTAVAAGLSEEQVAALPLHHRSALFTDHQRACLAYAEQYVVDVHGITDADAERVRQGMDDAQFVTFTIALGMFEGIGRMRLALGTSETSSGSSTAPLLIPTPAPGRAPH